MMLKRFSYGRSTVGLSDYGSQYNKKAICRVGGRGALLRSLVRKHSVERASSADLGCSSEYSIENIED